MNLRVQKKINEFNRFLDEVQGNVVNEVLLPSLDWSKVNLSKPQKAFIDSKSEINLFLAGQRTGKTFVGGIISGEYVYNNPEARGMICANTYEQLSTSTLFRIREVWKDYYGWEEYNPFTNEGHYVIGKKPPSHFDTTEHNYERYNNIISFINGAVVYFGSLDNYKALDGRELAWAILDETKDTKKEAVEEVILGRLSQPVDLLGNGSHFNPLYMLTSPAKLQWLNEWFFLDDFEDAIQRRIFSETEFFSAQTSTDKFIVISSTYHNKHNLPDNFIERQKRNLSSHLQDMLIYGSPFSKSGGEMYKGFDRNKHVKSVKYNPDLPIHLAYDFNINPYITQLAFQIEEYEGFTNVHLIKEYCLPDPKNRTIHACRAFKRDFQGHTAGLFYTGDATGKKQDTSTEKGFNNYTIIHQELKAFHPKSRVENKNPNVVPRVNFINLCLEQEYENIRVFIDPSCKNTIADFSYLKEGSDGTKHKEKDRKNGVSYEKYGHCSDAFDAFMTATFKKIFQKYLNGGRERRKPILGTYFKNRRR